MYFEASIPLIFGRISAFIIISLILVVNILVGFILKYFIVWKIVAQRIMLVGYRL